MKINELKPNERKQYYNDSDIFNVRPPKTPEKFKSKDNYPITLRKTYNKNYNTISTDISPIPKTSREIYEKNKKDHINDCLRPKTPDPYTMYNQRYKRIQELKKDLRKLQLDKSYEYNFDENNNVYRNITLNGQKGNLILGNDPTNFSSEYNNMLDYARKVMFKKKLKKDKMISDLNKSVDIPHKFMPLRRRNYNKKNVLEDIYNKKTTNFDMNISTDNYRNNLYYYKSNIFFDKEKEKLNENLVKINNDMKVQRYKDKLKYIQLQKEKSDNNLIKRRKTKFLYEEENKKRTGDIEENRKFCRDGNFPPQYADYKPKKEIKIKSLDDEYNAYNKRLYYGLSEMDRNTDKFVILDITKNDRFDSREIKNLFFKNGIHMFGEQTFDSYIENGKKGKFVFNIRKDLKDKNYNEKFKKVQNILLKKQGVIINLDNRKINYNKKIRTDITPTLAPFRGLKANRNKDLNNIN